MGLTQDAPEVSRRDFSMFRNGRSERAFASGPGELHVTSGLTNLHESGGLQFALYFAIRNGPHAALTSISSERICGATVATGGVK
jgi:hypothetical protein